MVGGCRYFSKHGPNNNLGVAIEQERVTAVRCLCYQKHMVVVHYLKKLQRSLCKCLGQTTHSSEGTSDL